MALATGEVGWDWDKSPYRHPRFDGMAECMSGKPPEEGKQMQQVFRDSESESGSLVVNPHFTEKLVLNLQPLFSLVTIAAVASPQGTKSKEWWLRALGQRIRPTFGPILFLAGLHP